MGPPSAQFVGQDDAHEVAGPLHQAQEEEVEEGVAGHVLHVDHHLVVDEGRGRESNGAEDGPDQSGALEVRNSTNNVKNKAALMP